MPTSTTRALAVPEILEAILLELDIRSVITSAQRVNHYWHDLIERSPSIQQALFFKPAPAVAGQQPVRNPLLANIFSHRAHLHKDDWYTDEQGYALGDQQLAPIFMRNGASWRRMLVRQPPILKLGLFMTFLDSKLCYFQVDVENYYPLPMRMDSLYGFVSNFQLSASSSWSFCDFRDAHAQEILKRISAQRSILLPEQRRNLCNLPNDADIVLVMRF